MRIGGEIRPRIDESIRLHYKLLLVLSQSPLASIWVKWAADIHRMRHIGDFRQWKDHDEYQKAFERLLRDLQAAP